MKKLLLLACLVLSMGVQAQSDQKNLERSKASDNWYIGINGGLATKAKHNSWLCNLDGNIGLRVGNWFTPTFGLAIESNAYFCNRPWTSTHTGVRYLDTSLAATINLSNWWFGYNGEPRLFELIAVPALGWGHVFANKNYYDHNLNDMSAKLALDFTFNVDKAKSMQVYIEPALIYSLTGNCGYAYNTSKFQMNIDRAFFQVNVGFVYKFKNSNGTHNFKYAEPEIIVDYDEINRLNGLIGQLEEENDSLRNLPPQVEEVIVETGTGTIPEGVVSFGVSSSKIDDLQYAQINKVAHYLGENPDKKVVLIGSASTDGNFESNKKLSEDRAAAVRDALVNKFGVSTERIEVVGAGETEIYSDDLEYNRVVVFQFIDME